MTDFPGRFAALTRALRSSRARAALVALAFVILSGCGKKGPPLAPFSSSPGAPAEVTVRRKGDQVEIHFKVPVANSDGRRPAKIDHVEAYALTMPAEKIHGEGKAGKGAKGGGAGTSAGKGGGGAGGRQSGAKSGGMSGGGAAAGGLAPAPAAICRSARTAPSSPASWCASRHRSRRSRRKESRRHRRRRRAPIPASIRATSP